MIKQECIGIPDMILLLMIFCFKKIKIKAEIVLSPGGAYFTNRKLQKNAIDRIRKFSKKKSHSAEKKRKKSNETKQSFGLASTFGNIKNLWFSARIEPTISCFSEN